MDLIQTVSVKLIYTDPFYGHLVMSAEKIRDDSLQAPMGVGIRDGLVKLFYNQKILEEILASYKDDWNYLLGIAEHEMLHIIFKHFMRRMDRNAIVSVGGRFISVWNIACDIAINQLIKKPLPLNPFQYDDFNFPKELTAEEYYALIIKQAKKNGSYVKVDALGNMMLPDGTVIPAPNQNSDNGDGGEEKEKSNSPSDTSEDNNPGKGIGGKWDETMKGKNLIDDHGLWRDVSSDDDKKNSQENAIVRSFIKKAVTHTKRMGKETGSIQEAIDEILKPAKIPWHRILRQFIGDTFKIGFRYTWKRLSRRFGNKQKGKQPIKALDIVSIIDTSGSVGAEEFNLFMAQIYSIHDSYPCNITIIECDMKIQKIYKLKKDIDIHFKGRGGTDFRPPFEYIKKNKIKCGLLVYLTDMAGTFPHEKPNYPVIWVKSPSRFGEVSNNAPFGRVIEIKE